MKAGSSWAWRMKKAAEEKGGKSPLKTESLGGKVTSFFFSNFPEDSSEADLWKIFREAGQVIDVFIAKKRNLAGKRFGFARFFKVGSPYSMEEKLNAIQLGNHTLRANVARKLKSEITRPGIVARPAIGSSAHSSYAEAVVGDPQRKGGVLTTGLKVININTNQDDKEKMARSLIGEALSVEKLKHIHELVMAEGIMDIKVFYVGGLQVQLQFSSKDAASNFKHNAKIVWSKWFSKLHFWSPTLDFTYRITSLSIIGVPPHAWLTDTFKEIGNLWGELISQDDNTESIENRDKGNIVIITEQRKWINETVVLKVDGRNYSILVVEDITDSQRFTPFKVWDEVNSVNLHDDEDDEWPEEDNEEDFLGGADYNPTRSSPVNLPAGENSNPCSDFGMQSMARATSFPVKDMHVNDTSEEKSDCREVVDDYSKQFGARENNENILLEHAVPIQEESKVGGASPVDLKWANNNSGEINSVGNYSGEINSFVPNTCEVINQLDSSGGKLKLPTNNNCAEEATEDDYFTEEENDGLQLGEEDKSSSSKKKRDLKMKTIGNRCECRTKIRRNGRGCSHKSVTPPDHGYGGNVRGLGDVIQVSQHIHA
ncbi:hypothetical protein LXL04_028463 [Taraxacum kok-saghyz]